jgi:hypothetical protein
MNLSPAHWIWFPSQRTLANTFVLFRRELLLDAPARLTGWLTADSRYRLTVNGQRVQWGPAPSDPRRMDVDPVDLTPYLLVGRNVIGVEVLFYGLGEGTWAGGKPGFICNLELLHADGRAERIVTDNTWLAFLDRAHRPGQYKRWFLRSLQEEFDARLHPYGWDTPEFTPDARWLPAMQLRGAADKPTSCIHYWEYLGSDTIDPTDCALRPRQIPPLREVNVPAARPAESGRVIWRRDPADWFEFRTPGAFEIVREPVVSSPWSVASGDDRRPTTDDRRLTTDFCRLPSSVFRPGEAVFLTYEFAEQIVGWPRFTIEAPEGTIVELMTQESHDPARTAWLDTHMFAWSRFICREGVNRFEAFDFESLRWLQLHIRVPDEGRTTKDEGRTTNREQTNEGTNEQTNKRTNEQANKRTNEQSASLHPYPPTPPLPYPPTPPRPYPDVVMREVGVRRRIYDWPNEPQIRCDEPELQRLFDACVNTLHNSAQETCVDGMGRERQQYSGDGGHQLHAIRYTFGETRLPARFLRTFSEGQTCDGYFLDCWPAYDRLARVMQRQHGATHWGPLLDHGVGFNFDCWEHYLQTGDLEALREPYPRLLRFADYLDGLRDDDDLLPVEGIGVPTVWIDHEAYRMQRHKQCAFNLYVAAMLEHALAPICGAFGDDEWAAGFSRRGQSILAATIRRFWSEERGAFVNNLPWLAEEGAARLCDRSLATALLFDQCPEQNIIAALQTLADCPPEMGISYPANATWRYQALARHGRIDVVLNDFRARWATMGSVIHNNTVQEFWTARPDTPDQWSHCAVSPLHLLFADIAGIRSTAPGFARFAVRPQLGDLGRLELTAHTTSGSFYFVAEPIDGGHRITLNAPPTCEGEVLLPVTATCALPQVAPEHRLGLRRCVVQGGAQVTFELPSHL